MQEPQLILADEPTSSLDPKTSVEVMEIMVRLASARDIPVLINIHNVELAKRFASRIPDKFDGYRNAAWLLKRHAVSVLPSVTSLKALRALAPGNAPRS